MIPSGSSDRCRRHSLPIISVCLSPHCGSFRPLCQLCSDYPHHTRDTVERLLDEAENRAKDVLKGLKAVKARIGKNFQENLSDQQGLSDVVAQVEELRRQVNNRIDSLVSHLHTIYQQTIRRRLSDLYDVVQKSEKFMEKERQKLFMTADLEKLGELAKFWVNDYRYQLKCFESSFEQIMKRRIPSFKDSLDQDRVFRLLVQFQTNLNRIVPRSSRLAVGISQGWHPSSSNGRLNSNNNNSNNNYNVPNVSTILSKAKTNTNYSIGSHPNGQTSNPNGQTSKTNGQTSNPNGQTSNPNGQPRNNNNTSIEIPGVTHAINETIRPQAGSREGLNISNKHLDQIVVSPHPAISHKQAVHNHNININPSTAPKLNSPRTATNVKNNNQRVPQTRLILIRYGEMESMTVEQVPSIRANGGTNPIGEINQRGFQNGGNNPNNSHNSYQMSLSTSFIGPIPAVYYQPTGSYYLFGNGTIESKKIYKYDIADHQLREVGEMEVARVNFQVCLLEGEIYIVGGENQTQGCLGKCEKFSPLPSSRSYLVCSLNQKSAHHTLLGYKNQFIVKVGGTNRMSLRDNVENTIHQTGTTPYAPTSCILPPTQQLHPQIYSLDTQQWHLVNLRGSSNLGGFSIGVKCLVCQVAENQVWVIGGNMASKKGYMANITQQSFETNHNTNTNEHNNGSPGLLGNIGDLLPSTNSYQGALAIQRIATVTPAFNKKPSLKEDTQKANNDRQIGTHLKHNHSPRVDDKIHIINYSDPNIYPISPIDNEGPRQHERKNTKNQSNAFSNDPSNTTSFFSLLIKERNGYIDIRGSVVSQNDFNVTPIESWSCRRRDSDKNAMKFEDNNKNSKQAPTSSINNAKSKTIRQEFSSFPIIFPSSIIYNGKGKISFLWMERAKERVKGNLKLGEVERSGIAEQSNL